MFGWIFIFKKYSREYTKWTDVEIRQNLSLHSKQWDHIPIDSNIIISELGLLETLGWKFINYQTFPHLMLIRYRKCLQSVFNFFMKILSVIFFFYYTAQFGFTNLQLIGFIFKYLENSQSYYEKVKPLTLRMKRGIVFYSSKLVLCEIRFLILLLLWVNQGFRICQLWSLIIFIYN